MKLFTTRHYKSAYPFFTGCAFFFLFLVSCQESESPLDYDYRDYLVDSIRISFPDTALFSYENDAYYHEGKTLVAKYDRKDREIYLFDLQKKKLLHRVPVSTRHKKEKVAVRMKNPEEFHVLHPQRGVLKLIDKRGKTIENRKLKEAFEAHYNAPMLYMSAGFRNPFRVEGKRLYCFARQDWREMPEKRKKEIFRTNPDHLFFLGEKITVKNIPTVFPSHWVDFRKRNAAGPRRYFGKDGKLIYCNVHSDSCVIYDMKTKKSTPVRTPSMYFEENIDYDENRNKDFDYVLKYLTENDRFMGLYYDPFRNLYYRFLSHGEPYINEAGKKVEFYDQDFSVIVLDEQFNKLKEVVFRGNSFDATKVIIGPEGMYLNRDELIKRKKNLLNIRTVNYGVFRLDQ